MISEAGKCPLCKSEKASRIFEAADRNQNLGGSFILAKCGDCGLYRIDPLPDLETLSMHYPAGYYPADPDIVLKDPLNRRWQEGKVALVGKYISEPGKLLDVGTGTRGLLTFFREAGWQVWGTEFSEEAADFVRKSWGLDIKVGDIDELGFENETFDVVTFWHVLEHLRNPVAAVAESFRILKKGGILVLALPNISSMQARIFGANWYHLDLPRHLYHFSPATARKLVEGSGFRILEIDHRSEEHNWAGWQFSLMPPNRNNKKRFPRPIRKSWPYISRALARIESAIGIGGTFTMVAAKE